MRKKILLVITKSSFGGAQRYVYDLATSLPRETFDITVAHGGTGVLMQKLKKAGIRTTEVAGLARNSNVFRELHVLIELVRLFRREKPGLVHLNSTNAGFTGALASRIARVPRIIFTAHGWVFTENRPFLVRSMYKVLQWIGVLLTHTTIAVSEHTKKEMAGMPFMDKKIVVIRNGIAPIDFLERARARQVLIKQSFPPHTAWIGTIAELHQNKGLSYAIKALADLTEFPWVWVVIGEGGEREKLEALIAKHGLTGRVFLLGFRENAARYLKAFDLFLLPSTKEGLPYTILEALDAHIPIVASAVGGIPEIVQTIAEHRLVPPKDARKLRQAIKETFTRKTPAKQRYENAPNLTEMLRATMLLHRKP